MCSWAVLSLAWYLYLQAFKSQPCDEEESPTGHTHGHYSWALGKCGWDSSWCVVLCLKMCLMVKRNVIVRERLCLVLNGYTYIYIPRWLSISLSLSISLTLSVKHVGYARVCRRISCAIHKKAHTTSTYVCMCMSHSKLGREILFLILAKVSEHHNDNAMQLKLYWLSAVPVRDIAQTRYSFFVSVACDRDQNVPQTLQTNVHDSLQYKNRHGGHASSSVSLCTGHRMYCL
jgi:hypothetical protein